MAGVSASQSVYRQKELIVPKFGAKCLLLELFMDDFIGFFYTSTTAPISTLKMIISPTSFFYFCTLLRSNFLGLWFPVDKGLLNSYGLAVTYFDCYLTASTLSILTLNAKQVSSISSLFSGFCWVERELREFSNLPFDSLSDTRRLLTDYTLHSAEHDNYKNVGYSLQTQEVFF